MFLERNSFLIFIFISLSCGRLKVATANTIFRFDFDLNVNDNSFKTSLKVGDGGEHRENSTEATAAEESSSTIGPPIWEDIWSKQAQFNTTANDKLQATRTVVTQLKNEITAAAGHSEFIAMKIKLMTRYLNRVNATNTTDADANSFLILQDYVQLVDDLRAPPTGEEGGERSLDYIVMKLGLEKHKLIELQKQILVEVLQATETWQTYVKQQLVDVTAV